MKKVILVFIGILLSVCAVQYTYAQGVTTASITGAIKDDKGEGLPGANVIAVHTPSGTRYGTSTQVNGRFVIPGMRVGGPYKVTITFVGYKESTQEDIYLSLGNATDLSFVLAEDGKELSEVVITADRSSVMSGDRTGAATNIAREQLERMPTVNRSFADFTRLTPQANGNSFAGRSGSFNNLTVDGAAFNNAFGLSGTVGGQTGAQPISLDAVEQIQVSIAPFDVRQGSFTGAGINAVTRSGTNEFSGSLFYLTRNQNFQGTKVDGLEIPNQNLSNQQFGFRFGGAIVKNKLFFFINAEQETRITPGTSVLAFRDGLDPRAANVSLATAAELDQISNYLKNTYSYDPGPYENYDRRNNSTKATIKLDWNISDKHKLSVKYNYLKSLADIPPSASGLGAGGQFTGLNFQSSGYIINNNFNLFIAELNSRFSDRASNTFQIGWTGFRDFRETLGSKTFPFVELRNGNNQVLTQFGFETFSANNVLNTNVFQISDNLTLYRDKHTFTIGTYNEFYSFQNGFSPNYFGRYTFPSAQAFYDNTDNNPATVGNPSNYQLSYSALPGNSGFPFAEFKAAQLGFYLQDEWAATKNLNFTIGLRADIPIITPSQDYQNPTVANATFRDGVKIDVSKLQKSTVLWSPRIGFNWDVTGDRSTQIRGGTGVFTGRVPYVWISNQIGNNGVLFGNFNVNSPASNAYPFDPNVDRYRPNNAAAAASYDLAVTDNNFKFPQVWRTNLAIDQKLPWGMIATLEGIYTKDVNAVYHQNINLRSPVGTLAGADNRSVFSTVNAAGGYVSGTQKINTFVNQSAVLMANTNQGYSYTITAQLQKTFGRNLFLSVAYNYADAKSVNDGGSIANSIWRDRQVQGDPNANILSPSAFLQRHRFIASASYRKEYGGFMATSISMFYEAAPADRFSYTYNGDVNGDFSGGGGNDLIYIPRNQSEIRLVDITGAAAGGTGLVYTAAQQWADLDKFISQDSYLSGRRGQYAERNGAQAPFYAKMDISIKQDFYLNVGGKRNTLQFSLDIFNFGNMLNNKWGIIQSPSRTALLNFVRMDTTPGAAPNTPLFTYPYRVPATQTSLTETFQNNTSVLASRWYMQFGVRYIFN